jgi:7,8-dihydropterin-6-yl-methyl-4-(beta-D-ribofuranosyl)aminobenzene 5'-phosphate synthase
MASSFVRLFVLMLVLWGTQAVAAQQTQPVTIQVLYDNYVSTRGLKADWGFSCLITGTDKTILFDTGTKPDVLLANMAAMQVDPAAAQVVVISHNHDDHTGGLTAVLERHGKPAVYLPRSCPKAMVERLQALGAQVTTVENPVEICKGVYVIGPDGDQIVEQSLVVTTSRGRVMLVGCSHPGVVPMVKHAKEHLKQDIDMVYGGMHLMNKTEAEVRQLAEELKKLGVQLCGATHCTGEKAIAVFKQVFGESYVPLGVGTVIDIGVQVGDVQK